MRGLLAGAAGFHRLAAGGVARTAQRVDAVVHAKGQDGEVDDGQGGRDVAEDGRRAAGGRSG
ncbi:MAG: hypothetical protein AVDCRST_MAG53-3344 [uncultured Solirubrobacteraceae bacterium]|uniref:Uncharacterized protein n=1 Tax=uncultured Solirubrobacteraceae bacterium TaxID=1162706 RepID=A0A6J4TAU7_9ACTN|nr:MAG: hypothetical protein AVDCRST_MAG53-3344 [uncultured Solirubrobacteraceae bacterium]